MCKFQLNLLKSPFVDSFIYFVALELLTNDINVDLSIMLKHVLDAFQLRSCRIVVDGKPDQNLILYSRCYHKRSVLRPLIHRILKFVFILLQLAIYLVWEIKM